MLSLQTKKVGSLKIVIFFTFYFSKRLLFLKSYTHNKIQPSIEVLFTIAEILNMEAKELIEKRDLKDNK